MHKGVIDGRELPPGRGERRARTDTATETAETLPAGCAIERAAQASRELNAGLSPSPTSFLALSRAAGNRSAARLLSRQPAHTDRTPVRQGSSTVTGRFLRVRIVGHASARWRSARTAEEAAARNLELSERRAAAVKKIVLRELEGKVPVPIDLEVCVADEEEDVCTVADAEDRPEDRSDMTLGAHGEGSREALERTSGDRRSDERRDRRVDIEAELTTTERRSERVKVRHSAITRDWLLTVTRLHEVTFGVGTLDVELELRNPLSGKVAKASASLGVISGKPSFKKKPKPQKPWGSAVGRPNMPFRTDRPAGFKDFDGRWIRIHRVNAKLGFGYSWLLLYIDGLRKGRVKLEGKWGLGLPGGLISVGGKLRLHNIPDDFWDTYDDLPPSKHRDRAGEGLSVMYDTGSAVVSRADVDRIKEFAAMWGARLQ